MSAPVFWLTGLSGAGKTTVSDHVLAMLKERGIKAVRLDGDELRTGLCSDLGFSPEERLENIRRAAEVAKLFAGHGIVTFCSFISPLQQYRDLARRIIGDSFVEVYMKASVEECMRRDPKGLYAKALAGGIPEFTGISAPYEIPANPELVVQTEGNQIEASAQLLLDKVLQQATSKTGKTG